MSLGFGKRVGGDVVENLGEKLVKFLDTVHAPTERIVSLLLD